jgi:drug/metabolite transporter (DMT)-like permease
LIQRFTAEGVYPATRPNRVSPLNLKNTPGNGTEDRDRIGQLSALRWILLSVVLNAAGQVLLKQAGSLYADGSFSALFLHWEIWVAMAVYAASAVCWLWVLSRVDLSMAYPFLALTFPVVAGLSAFFFSEPVTEVRWAGVGLIVAGVWLLRRS